MMLVILTLAGRRTNLPSAPPSSTCLHPLVAGSGSVVLHTMRISWAMALGLQSNIIQPDASEISEMAFGAPFY